jgi:hypothetical protein
MDSCADDHMIESYSGHILFTDVCSCKYVTEWYFLVIYIYIYMCQICRV